ncbi:hypothetical protein ACN9ML_04410 [Dyadobacter endophyticus]|uniref:hypothetical protein n=1 Tax=Dyadobacter TaxID=120831 RepID=UPI003CED7C98
MRQQDWLFPHVFRKAGWLIVAVLSIFFLVLRSNAGQEYFDSYRNGRDYPLSWADYTDIIVNVFIIGFAIGLILIAFSREKHEDEMIQKLRLQALQWSVYANYIVLILCSLLFYWTDFFNVLVLNMYTVLLAFIIVFRWTLHQMNKESLS